MRAQRKVFIVNPGLPSAWGGCGTREALRRGQVHGSGAGDAKEQTPTRNRERVDILR